MQLKLLTWNYHNINDATNYESYIPLGQLVNLTSQPIYIPRSYEFPYLSTAVLTDHSYTIEIKLLGTIGTQREEIKQWFAINDFNPHTLVAEDLLDSNRQWYLSGIPVHVIEIKPSLLAVTLAVDEPVWKTVSDSSETWHVTTSGDTDAITVLGNTNARPVITLTPTSSRTGSYAYKRWIPIINPISVKFGNYFAEITNGGLDTAALVIAGKMLATGDDLRVMYDGSEVDRWLADINTNHTKVWIDANLSSGQKSLLSGSIANSGAVGTVSVKQNSASLAVLKAMGAAANKVFLIGTEAFTYTATNLTYYTITGCTRAQKGTSMAAHSDGDAVNWIEHDIWMLYGYATATAPAANDANKPLLNLSNATNASLIWSNFYDSSSPRPGAWAPAVNTTLGKSSTVFTDNHGALVNPSTELGVQIKSWQTQNHWQSETADVQWSYYNPAGFTNIVFSGASNYVGGTWPVTTVQSSIDGKLWTTLYTVTAPAGSWSAFNSTQAISNNPIWIRVDIKGSVPGTSTAEADCQWDTITLTANYIPTITLGSEIANYQMLGKITNVTTGEYLTVNYLMDLNKALTIDCNAKEAYYYDGSPVLSSIAFSTVRSDWLDIAPGTNTLKYEDTGTGNVTVGITWTNRMM